MWDFTAGELHRLRSLRSPYGVQRFLDGLPYHLATTAWSPRRVLAEGTAHCLEAAIFAAAALRVLGWPPLIFDVEADRDTDHVIAIYKVRGLWGAVAKSNYAGLEFREPVYRTLRELALSYFPFYFNLRRERTLRRYSFPVDLSRFDRLHWMTTQKSVWSIPEHLLAIRHYPLFPPAIAKRFNLMEERTYQAGLHGHRWDKTTPR